MAEAFDPYYVWLGIPPEEQPADHYRLLGLRRFEASAAVIDNAADRAMGHVRTVTTGKHGAEAQRLLNELSAARVCLLSSESRDRYDAELRAKLAPRMRFPPPPVPAQLPSAEPTRPQAAHRQPSPAVVAPVATAPSVPSPTYHRKSSANWVAPLFTFVAVVAIGMVGYTMWRNRDDPVEPVASGGATRKNDEPQRDVDQSKPPEPGAPGEASKKPSVPEIPSIRPPDDEPRMPDAPEHPPMVVPPPDAPPHDPPDEPGHSDDAPPDAPDEPLEIPTTSTDPPPPDFASVAKRSPVPAAAELDARKAQIRDLFRAELARTKPADLIATAKSLLDHSRNTKDDLVGKYALLDTALKLAVDNGDVGVSKEIVLDIITFYEVDSLKLKAETLLELGRAPLVPAMKHVYFQGAWPVVRELMEGERYELVPRLTGLLLPIAQLYRDRQLVQDVKDAERDARELREAYEPLQPLVDRLAKTPDDPEACAAIGKFRCFHVGDWPRGLPLLAKGNDAALAKLAAADLANPTDGRVQTELGDAWREVAKAIGGKRQELEINERAVHWYELARATLGGLNAAKVTQSLKELTRKPRHHVDAQKFGAHWYKVFHDKVGWHEAKRRCEAMGGYLVCIETKEEAAFIHRIMGHTNRGQSACWTGLTREGRTEYGWINGSPTTFQYWAPGQPDNAGGGEFHAELTPRGFNDLRAAEPIRFVCEWEN